MQTFLPYSNFKLSAECLDYRRLGKQRVECLQLLQTITDDSKVGWKNHPCAKMWTAHKEWLAVYGMIMCIEWKKRGYKDTCFEKIKSFLPDDLVLGPLPKFIGNKDFHKSHQSNLLRKNLQYYSKYFEKDVPSDLPYIWE